MILSPEIASAVYAVSTIFKGRQKQDAIQVRQLSKHPHKRSLKSWPGVWARGWGLLGAYDESVGFLL